METKLARISQMSAENPDLVFTSLYHLINCGMLRDCHNKMDGTKAVGVDGITKEGYEKNLEGNLKDLQERLKRKAYIRRRQNSSTKECPDGRRTLD